VGNIFEKRFRTSKTLLSSEVIINLN